MRRCGQIDTRSSRFSFELIYFIVVITYLLKRVSIDIHTLKYDINEKRCYIWRSHRDKQKRIVVDLSDHVLANTKSRMPFELKALLLDKPKPKVNEVEEDKKRLETWVESVESELNKAQEEIKNLKSKSSDNEFAFMELEEKLLSTQDELLEISAVAARYEWECEQMGKEHERDCL